MEYIKDERKAIAVVDALDCEFAHFEDAKVHYEQRKGFFVNSHWKHYENIGIDDIRKLVAIADKNGVMLEIGESSGMLYVTFSALPEQTIGQTQG
jgi:hypothetical protein